MTKAETISWFRIQEMFRFQSFHMYGVIFSALAVGILLVQLVKRRRVKTISGEPIVIHPKKKGVSRYLFGGILFGLGWALSGVCPGPMFVLIGNGFEIFFVVLVSAIFGTFLYGVFKKHLPH